MGRRTTLHRLRPLVALLLLLRWLVVAALLLLRWLLLRAVILDEGRKRGRGVGPFLESGHMSPPKTHASAVRVLAAAAIRAVLLLLLLLRVRVVA